MAPYYEFGPFRFDAGDRLLYHAGEVVSLTPKAIDTLHTLLVHHGHVLEKEAIIKAVWPDTYVEEGGLSRNISLLRKVLGETEDGGSYIETIPKRGYRFAAPVKETNGATEPEPGSSAERRPRRAVVLGLVLVVILVSAAVFVWRARRSAGTVPAVRSLVVLPLENLSRDPEQEYFADGMTDAVLTDLAGLSALKVISYPRAEFVETGKSPSQIARDLRVDAALTGSVVRARDRVRINARLVRARTAEQIWAEGYERRLSDVLDLQREVAEAIAGAIQVQVTRPEQARLTESRTVVPEAYEAYAKGRYYWDRRSGDGLEQAMGYFQQAIERDPGFPQAYSGLADVYALLGSMPFNELPAAEAMPRAKQLALQAIALDDKLAEAYTSLAYVKLSYDWDLHGAREAFERAIHLRPSYATAHHWYAHYHLARGAFDEAITEMEKARELDPYSHVINVGVGWCEYFAGRYDQAVEQYAGVLDAAPGFYMGHYALGLALEASGNYGEAIAAYERASSLSGENAGAIAALGHAFARSGRKRQARERLDQLIQLKARGRCVPSLYLAYLEAALGEEQRALESIRRACEERDEYMIYARVDPTFQQVRSIPGFERVMACVSVAQ